MARSPTIKTDSRTRIVQVAAQMLHDRGPEAVTTRGVAEAAGVQAPAIYRLFGDKDGLLEAVAEHVMATLVTAKAADVEAASAGNVDPVTDLRAGWDGQIAFGLANPAVFGLLSDPSRVERSPAARSGHKVLERRVHRVALAGRLCVSEARAVAIIHAAGVGTIQTLLAAAPQDRDPGLADAMYAAVLGQIVSGAPSGQAPGPAAAAVTLRAVVPNLAVLSDGERGLFAEWLDRVIASELLAAGVV